MKQIKIVREVLGRVVALIGSPIVALAVGIILLVLISEKESL